MLNYSQLLQPSTTATSSTDEKEETLKEDGEKINVSGSTELLGSDCASVEQGIDGIKGAWNPRFS